MKSIIWKIFVLVCVAASIVFYLTSSTAHYLNLTPSSDNCNCDRSPSINQVEVPVPTNKTDATFKLQKYKNGKFGVIRNVFVGEENPLTHDVSIVTHFDGTRLGNIIDLSNAWEGPLQLTVFLSSRELWNSTIRTIRYVRNHVPNVKKFVSFHLLFPLRKDYYVAEKEEDTEKQEETVSEFISFPSVKDFGNVSIDQVLQTFSEKNMQFALKDSTREHIAFYPQTIAMNLALSSCKTEYFLCIDSDLVPSKGLRKQFIKFAEDHNLYAPAAYYNPNAKVGDIPHTKKDDKGQCYIHVENEIRLPDMYVIPAFQSKKEYPIPRTHKDLSDAVKAKTAGRFFEGIDSYSYPQTDHWKWLTTSDGGDSLSCLHEVKYTRLYEPFVITRKGIPKYDERFSGWSEVESHHKLLLATLGYRFIVLQNGFLVHKGWKVSSHISEQKRREREFHRGVWNDFNKELKLL